MEAHLASKINQLLVMINQSEYNFYFTFTFTLVCLFYDIYFLLFQ